MASASTATPESGFARRRLIASRSRTNPSRSTFMSSRPANTGSWGYRRFGVTDPAPSANCVTARTRNVLSAASASRRVACARSSWLSRMPVSCTRLSRFKSAAAATNRSAIAFTVAVTATGSGPPSSRRRKLASGSAAIFRARPSALAASLGPATVNSTLRRGRNAPARGTHANPWATPTESPTAGRSSTLRALGNSRRLNDSVRPLPESFTTSRYAPGRTRCLMSNVANRSESAAFL